ncbi:uncharacterized protein MONBRDRAFT_33272 [Monosiga brevicollis MX1]|uniref:Uncharacterized protein n=1 Tax=Monosiga brevicollis TaxID=81824 RepID=A9V4H1_MONBE|nr:uncharacterized protein MONBRDRAFT_33272 [Monosiga brevicollis MX1]EDQ87614.1 predicted protein [Monosiga brevicollis MX1]|eukprot:XP_001747534.1 hypothetical protein [Monosiga brevicollis MX1]
MKLFDISIFDMRGDKPVILTEARDLSSFNFFQRSSVEEYMNFFTTTLAERTDEGVRQSVQEKQYFCHVHNRQDKLCGVVIVDEEYPARVAFSIISKALEEFKSKYPVASWTSNPRDMPFPELAEMLKKYQDPAQADSMLKVQQELDETKVVLHKAMESVLKRDEHLDDLVAKSDQLSSTSKVFYKKAKAANSCCVVV